jgi:hypothetical protein
MLEYKEGLERDRAERMGLVKDGGVKKARQGRGGGRSLPTGRGMFWV